MFCKWCGGTLTKTDTKCKRCGNEVPALSDCGGFYDLVPKAKVNTEETSIVQSASPKQVSGPNQRKDGKYKRNNKHLGMVILTAAMLCCFALVFLSLFVLHSELRQYADNVNQLKTEQGVPVLEEQHIVINLNLRSNEDKEGVSSKVDLGKCSDVISTVLLFDDENAVLTGVRYMLDDDRGAIELQIGQEVAVTGIISIFPSVDEDAFGTIDGEVSYQWQYRATTDAEWVDLDKDVFTQEDGSDQSSLSYNVDELEALMDEDAGCIELQCVLKRENTQGGTLIITIENIVISKIEPDDQNNIEQ